MYNAVRVAAVIVLLVACRSAGAAAQAPLRLDHVPIGVRDLDVAAATWRALGFSLKPGRLHANSVRNVHIKFPDGSALELIPATEPRDAQAAQYLALQADREGAAYLSVGGGPVADLVDRMATSQLAFDTARGPYFEALTFPAVGPLAYVFFILVYSRPPDLPAHITHASTACRLDAVWVARSSLESERSLLVPLGARERAAPVTLPMGRATVLELGSGSVHLVQTGDAAVPPEATHGVWLELLQPAGPRRPD